MAPLPLSRTSMTKTLIVDPGAHSIKAGFAQDDAQCRVIPNCIARSRDKQTYVGSDLSRCTDYGEMVFRRPAEKGYIVNWDAERLIWEREFFDSDAPLKVSFRSREYPTLLIVNSVIRTKRICYLLNPRMHFAPCSRIQTRFCSRSSSLQQYTEPSAQL